MNSDKLAITATEKAVMILRYGIGNLKVGICESESMTILVVVNTI
ncbi:hypothetical protein [Marinibactrum halimedae]|nr:hypothetical protein [Marinibactrum halimedae]